jgi:hypothetical protein
MLHMEEVRRVMRPKVMCHIRQQAWCLIACRLDYLTVETDKGLFHEFLPGVLIACLCRLLQQNWLRVLGTAELPHIDQGVRQ